MRLGREKERYCFLSLSRFSMHLFSAVTILGLFFLGEILSFSFSFFPIGQRERKGMESSSELSTRHFITINQWRAEETAVNHKNAFSLQTCCPLNKRWRLKYRKGVTQLHFYNYGSWIVFLRKKKRKHFFLVRTQKTRFAKYIFDVGDPSEGFLLTRLSPMSLTTQCKSADCPRSAVALDPPTGLSKYGCVSPSSDGAEFFMCS